MDHENSEASSSNGYVQQMNEALGRPTVIQQNGGDYISCGICHNLFRRGYKRAHLQSSEHKRALRSQGLTSNSDLESGIIIRSTSNNTVYDVLFTPSREDEFSLTRFQGSLQDSAEDDFLTIESFFAHFQEAIISHLNRGLRRLINLKVDTSLSLTIQRTEADGNITTSESSLRTPAQMILQGDDLEEWFIQLGSIFIIKFEEMPERGSNWTLARVNDFELHISRYTPLIAGSHVSLPQSISNRKAVINVQNTDEKCFAYAIMSKVLYERRVRNPQRPTQYRSEIWQLFNFNNIRFPTPIKDIKIFERDNNASVNIFGIENDLRGKIYVYPIRVSDNISERNHFDLLYLYEEKNGAPDGINGHYCFIINLSRLVLPQIRVGRDRIFICPRCLTHFGREDLLGKHTVLCKDRELMKCCMPEGEKTILKFKNYKFKQSIPYIVYADLECALQPFSSVNRDPNLAESFTEKRHLHIPTSYCYYIVCHNDVDTTNYEPRLYRGEKAIEKFWISLREDLRKISDIYEIIHPIIPPTPAEMDELNRNVTCHICNHTPSENEEMCLDHCHLTGKTRGWSCNSCNLNYQLPNFVPVVFHNGSHYDFKMLVSEVYTEPPRNSSSFVDRRRRPGQQEARNNFVLDEVEAGEGEEEEDDNEIENNDVDDEGENNEADNEEGGSNAMQDVGRRLNGRRRRGEEIKVIAKNCENFISFEVPITNSLSARFIDSFRFMPSSLCELASNLGDAQMEHTSKFFPGDLFALARRKGVFPYEFVKSLGDYNTTGLPSIEAFYSSLNDETISESEYEHGKRVWEAFTCENLGDYSDVYQKIDVVLLSDVFENFRKLCSEVYEIDPPWMYSAPGLAWNAMLKYTNVRIQLFSDITMYQFCEASIKGGYSCASLRYAEANNPDMPNFDPTRETSYLLYTDANNLYGYGMSALLPLNEFRWLDDGEIATMNVPSLPEDGDVGYILEVDIEYPPELHDAHNDFPFCPQQLKTRAEKNAPKKLIATLHDKNNYIVHYRYLQLALKHGLKLKKIHRGVCFHQEKWLEPYIRLNNDLRTHSTDDFSKNFYKLMNNSVFGKTLESTRKHRNFVLTNSLIRIRKLVKKPNFKSRVILNERTNLVLIEMGRTKMLLDKFIQAGTSILDISRDLMYRFHYDIIKGQIFPSDEINLMYTDTDSLIYHIKVPSLSECLLPYKQHFDFSEYPRNHLLYDPTNKKVLGKMKDELHGGVMTKCTALKSKLYAFTALNKPQFKKAKGVRRHVVRKKLSFEDYERCLRTGQEFFHNMQGIRSYKQIVYTVEQKKKTLTAFDDKRCVLEDGIHTFSWGNYNIPHDEDLIYLLNYPANE